SRCRFGVAPLNRRRARLAIPRSWLWHSPERPSRIACKKGGHMPENKVNELVGLFSQDDVQENSVRLASEHPADIAAALQETEPARAWPILKDAARPRQADIFGYLDL